MTSFLTANVLLGFLVGLLIALIVYWLQQQRIRKQRKMLQQLQRQHEQLDQTQVQHLNENVRQMRQSYKAELAQTIEHYQDQLAERIEQVREEYEARIEVMQLAQPVSESETASSVDWPEDEPTVANSVQPATVGNSSELTATLSAPVTPPPQPTLDPAQLDAALQQFRLDLDQQMAERLKQQQRLLVQQITDFKQAYDGRLRSLEQMLKSQAQAAQESNSSNANTETY